ALGREQPADGVGGGAVDPLVEEREHEQRSVERHAEEEQRRGGRAEPADPQEADVEQRPLPPAAGVEDEAGEQRRAGGGGGDDGGVGRVGRAAGGGQAGQERGEPGGGQGQAGQVESGGHPAPDRKSTRLN